MKLGAKDVEKYLWMQAKKSCKAIEFYQEFNTHSAVCRNAGERTGKRVKII